MNLILAITRSQSFLNSQERAGLLVGRNHLGKLLRDRTVNYMVSLPAEAQMVKVSFSNMTIHLPCRRRILLNIILQPSRDPPRRVRFLRHRMDYFLVQPPREEQAPTACF